MVRYCDAVVDNSTVYYKNDGDSNIYAYHILSSNWSTIPDCPLRDGYAIAFIEGLLTTVGGYGDDLMDTNKLFSLTGDGNYKKWTEKFPPMPTKRYYAAALCPGTALIVAGGCKNDFQKLKTVEVLNTKSRQWHTAPDLPKLLPQSSLTPCGDLVYLLGGVKKIDNGTHSVYSCLLDSLLLSAGSKSLAGLVSTLTRSKKASIWNRVADLPVHVTLFTSVTLHGQLLAIGGKDSYYYQPTTAVHMYQPTANSWEVINHMTTPRYRCSAAVLPDNQLMVVGGRISDSRKCDSVEFGRLIKL